MRHIKLTIAYDGTNYCGWQIQENGTAVQELIQQGVRRMTGEENNVVGAGRTDAGVHALAQTASFRTEKNIPLEGFKLGLNCTLPRDIRVIGVEEVRLDFHPVRDAKSKHYRYLISEALEEHPLYLNRVWAVGRTLDIEKMREAAEHIIGRHDFSSFAAAGGALDNPVREVYEVDIVRILTSPPLVGEEQGGSGMNSYMTTFPLFPSPQGREKSWMELSGCTISIDITGNGFLKQMVRNIVGTLVDVGTRRTAPDELGKILEARDRRMAGRTAPAHGLYLVGVEY